MVSFTTNFDVKSRVGAQHNGTFRGWHEMQRRDTAPAKTNGSKTSNSLEKLGNIASTRLNVSEVVQTYIRQCKGRNGLHAIYAKVRLLTMLTHLKPQGQRFEKLSINSF